MLYIGIPAFNEATTIGVLLWRLRSVLADVSREYEVVVYDDASTDQTAQTLEPYTRVLPLTVLRGSTRVGYGRAVDAIARHVSKTTRYPRRDALLLLQGDFTDPPALVPEFLRRFEGGADLILGERTVAADAPLQVQRLWKAARWVLRPFVGITDVRDLTSSYRLVRVAVLRDLIKASADEPIAVGDAWNANADFALRAAALARRVETIPVTPTYLVRTRDSRRTAWPDAIALAKWGWGRRGDRVAVRVIARTAEVAEPVVEEPLTAELPERAAPERRERSARPERSGRPERKPRRERSDREERATDEGDGSRRRAERDRRPKRDREAPSSSAVEGAEPGGAGAVAGAGSSTGAGVGAGAGAGAAAADRAGVDSPGESGEATGAGEIRARKPRPRRRRGRKDRATGEAGNEGEQLAASPSDGANVESSNERTPVSEARHGANESDTDTDTDTDTDAPRKRKRSRRGRRKRTDGAAGNDTAEGAEGADSRPEGSEGSEGTATGRRSGRVATDAANGGTDSNADHAPDSNSEHNPSDGTDRTAGAESPKRRRSRRGRRGGSRRREGDSAGERAGDSGGDDAGGGSERRTESAGEGSAGAEL